MSQLELDIIGLKEEIIQKLDSLMAFFNNNQGKINPVHQAQMLETYDKIVDKCRQAFKADEEINEVLRPYQERVEQQKNLIAIQEKKLERFNVSEGQENDPDDEYHGVIIKGEI